MRMFLFLFLCGVCNCTNESKVEQNEVNTNTAILLFKAEQKIEIWNNGIIQNAAFQSNVDFPIGIYEWQKENKTFQNTTDTLPIATLPLSEHIFTAMGQLPPQIPVFIFPNDAREREDFIPCMRCPHQTAILYSTLWLYLQEFKIEK